MARVVSTYFQNINITKFCLYQLHWLSIFSRLWVFCRPCRRSTKIIFLINYSELQMKAYFYLNIKRALSSHRLLFKQLIITPRNKQDLGLDDFAFFLKILSLPTLLHPPRAPPAGCSTTTPPPPCWQQGRGGRGDLHPSPL